MIQRPEGSRLAVGPAPAPRGKGVGISNTRPAPAPRNKAPKPAPTKQRTLGPAAFGAVKRRLAQLTAAERRAGGDFTPTQQQRQQLSEAASNYTQGYIMQRRGTAEAQKMAAARGPTQQGLQAPAGSKGQGFARQMSAAEAQKITRTRPKGFAKGGLTKSTGKMNTGIKKCGE